MKYSENMNKMIEDHLSMKNWHETMAKSAAEMMQDHIKAASWHDSQSNMIKGMIQEVPLDPETKKMTVPAGSYAATTPSKTKATETEVPLDPQTVKKGDLVAILKAHEEEFGSFDMSAEDIASFLLAKQPVEAIVVSIIVAIGGILAALVQKGRVENRTDHNEVASMIKLVHEDVSKVGEKLDNHITWHLDKKDE